MLIDSVIIQQAKQDSTQSTNSYGALHTDCTLVKNKTDTAQTKTIFKSIISFLITKSEDTTAHQTNFPSYLAVLLTKHQPCIVSIILTSHPTPRTSFILQTCVKHASKNKCHVILPSVSMIWCKNLFLLGKDFYKLS